MKVGVFGSSGDLRPVIRPRPWSARGTVAHVQRAWTLGLITNTDVRKGLNDKLVAAQKAHLRNQHSTEWKQLAAFVEQLLAQSGKGIDATTAIRFIGYAEDLIASGG